MISGGASPIFYMRDNQFCGRTMAIKKAVSGGQALTCEMCGSAEGPLERIPTIDKLVCLSCKESLQNGSDSSS